MKFRVFLATGLVILLASLGLTGCTAGTGAAATGAQSTINLNNQQGIWVSGQGKVTVKPDIATLSLGISAQASTVQEALAQGSSAMDRVMKALTDNGIEDKDIQTQYFNINPQYRFDNATQQSTISGYQVSNIITVKIRAIDNTGRIIDAVAAGGGDNTRVNGVSFSVDQPEKFYSQARSAAMNDAKAKAENLADLAKVGLGKAIYITESSGSQQPIPLVPPVRGETGGSATPGTSISPGQTDIILYVQVAYSIE